MNSLKEIEQLKSLTEKISKTARLDKAAVDSLMRQRDRLKAQKYLKHRLQKTQKDAEMQSKCDEAVIEIDEKINSAEIEAGKSWAKLEAHRIHIDLLRSYHSTKREELKQGL